MKNTPTDHPSQNSFTACLIGDGTMLIHCAELLLENGHKINGILSENPAIHAWATEAGISSLHITDDYTRLWKAEACDYLFSIVNLRMLPQEVLALPKRLAINFHDGPLPRYAGINATSWAILNQESNHGVTWHVMEPEADTGDILKSRQVTIAPNDTSASLNMKCYEAGIESFRELLGDIGAGTLDRRTQDFSQRSYFGKWQRPAGGCILSWSASADSIAAQYRAFEFGSHPNNFGLLKLWIGTDLILIRRLEMLEAASGEPAGKVLKVTGESIQVATVTNDILLTRLETIDGQSISIATFAKTYGIQSGSRFSDAEPKQLNRITKTWQQACRYDAWWAKDQEIRPAELPYKTDDIRKTGQRDYRDFAFEIPGEISHILKQYDAVLPPERMVFTTFLAFLYRMSENVPFRVSVKHPDVSTGITDLENYFSDITPFPLPPDGETATIARYFDYVNRRYETMKKRGALARDIRARYPCLHTDADNPIHGRIPILIEFAEPMAAGKDVGNYDFCMVIEVGSGNPVWRVDLEVMQETDVRRFWDQYTTFLQGIVQMPAQSIMEVSVLPVDEWQQVLVENNRTERAYPAEKGMHELFSEIAGERNDAVAVICGQEQISYGELDRKSTFLALFLQKKNIGKGSYVGIFLDRSVEMMVALLGVLKSGAAYIPLDPIYPKDRLEFMIEDSGLSVLLTIFGLEEKLPDNDALLIRVDAEWEQIENTLAMPSENGQPVAPNNRFSPEDLAYVIYTSGSTGLPKGVQVYHRGLTNFLWSMAETPGIDQSDKLLALTTICFDIAALELYLPLIRGAMVEIVPTEICRDGVMLKEYIEQSNATMIQATPTTWQMLISAGWEHDKSLKILCGGEALPGELAGELLKRSDELWNLFGPTETTIWSSCCRIDDPARISIGRPIANTQLYVLDENLNPVPIGIPGELYIGGDGVAAGYLDRPALTASKFVQNPFVEGAAEKMYRTGDLVCYRTDGSLEYLNRMDTQVKIRGYRIELGEIEALLKEEDCISQAIAILEDDRAGSKRILAYVILQTGAELPQAVTANLKDKLPPYMIPASIIPLTKYPLTPNGKLNRKALPRPPERNATTHRATQHGPGMSLEETISAVWKETLLVESIGIHDTFFDVGGDSISLTKVVWELGNRFDRRFTSTDMFQYPTIHSFATFLRSVAKADKQMGKSPENGKTKINLGSRIKRNDHPKKRLSLRKRNRTRD